MRIAVGALLFEGNTFSLSRIGIAEFERNYLFEGPDILEHLRHGEVEVSGALSVLDAAGADVVPLIATHGGCGGMITAACFHALKSRLIGCLEGQDLDGVFLALHGAMVCEGTDDAEAELLAEVRRVVGQKPLVITLDLHAHITPLMLDLCDGIVGYQHYPHDDPFETGARGAGLLIKAVGRSVDLRIASRKIALLVSPTAAGTREPTPFRDLYKACRALEALPGILAVSYFPSTPWVERRDGGTAFVAVTDGPVADIEARLAALAANLWDRRAELQPELTTVDAVLARPVHEDGPVILSEMSDAVGAGAGGDSAYVLEKYIASGRTDPFLIQVLDPEVVALAHSVGRGRPIACELGNKIETRHGPPACFSGRVDAVIEDGAFTYSGGLMGGIRSTVGRAAVLRTGSVTVLVTSRPAYEYADEQYRAAGINVRDYKFVVVKNPMNYKQAFRWAPERIPLDTPGAGRADLRRLEWRVCERPFHPLDDADAPILR